MTGFVRAVRLAHVRRGVSSAALIAALAASLVLTSFARAEDGDGGSNTPGEGGSAGTALAGASGGGGGGGGGDGQDGVGLDGGDGGDGDGGGGNGGTSISPNGDNGASGALSISNGGGGGGGRSNNGVSTGPITVSGGNGGNGASSGINIGDGGGGGGGGTGLLYFGGAGTFSGAITGGDGGDGGDAIGNGAAGDGGGGGGGGHGLVVISPANMTIGAGAIVQGGDGGMGGNGAGVPGQFAGDGGNGGSGIRFDAPGGWLTVEGSVTGGGRGLGGLGGGADNGAAGSAIVGSGLAVTVAGTGSVIGGDAGAGFALRFDGGANSLTLEDGATIGGGILVTGSLEFDQTDDYTLASVIDGSGSVEKTGSGILTLTGLNNYGGDTTISDGTLLVNGSLMSSVYVENGGTLGGSGFLNAVTVRSGGTFAPGNSIDMINTASLDLQSGSIFEVEINNGGFVAGVNNDYVDTGNATIEDGAIIDIKSFPAGDDGSTYTPGRYTILKAGVLDVQGQITLNENFAFLDFDYAYDAVVDELYLDSSIAAAATSFCLPGQTSNQCATGDGAFPLGAGNSVFDQLLVMNAADAAAALGALSGEIHASAQGVFVENSAFVRDAALNRLRSAFDQYGGGDTPVSAYLPADAIGPAHDRATVWAQGFGGFLDKDSDGNASSLDSSEYGFLAGADGFISGDWRLGFLAGYSRSDIDVDDLASSGESDNAHLGIYGGTEWGRIGLRAGLANSWHFVDTERTALGNTLEADYEARTTQGFAELGYRFDQRSLWFEPFANAAFVLHHSDGFTETGGVGALTVEDNDTETGFTTLGLRAAADFMLGDIAATARGTLGWRHAFGDITPDSVHSFAGGTAFTIEGTPIAEDAAVVEAGLDFAVSDAATLGVHYTGQFAEDALSASGQARLSVRF